MQLSADLLRLFSFFLAAAFHYFRLFSFIYALLVIVIGAVLSLYACRHIVFNGVILSTDDYFVNHQGVYQHDSRFLQQAHMWNQQRGI